MIKINRNKIKDKISIDEFKNMIQSSMILIGGKNQLNVEIMASDEQIQTCINENKLHELENEILQRATKEKKIAIGTLLKADNVSCFIGAGCSIDAGGTTILKIPKQVEKNLLRNGIKNEKTKDWLKLFYDIVWLLKGIRYEARDRLLSIEKEAEEIEINLEEFFSKLYTFQEAYCENAKIKLVKNGHVRTINKDLLGHLIKELKLAYISTLQLPASGKQSAIEVHKKFIKKILTRPLNLRRVSIFTSNNDTLLEQAIDENGVVNIDGFIGNLKAVFRPECYDQDLYFPAQTTEGKVHRLDRVIHLYKLHGSINWHKTEPNIGNPYGLYSDSYMKNSDSEDVIIYPTPLKYGLTLGFPYSELMRRFANKIIQPQSVLFVIGYGFGDEHINAIIRQALTIPSFTLIIVSPVAESNFVKILLQQDDTRIWVIKGRKIGTFEGFVKYLLPDLKDEDIQRKVINTYKAIEIKELKKPDLNKEPKDDE